MCVCVCVCVCVYIYIYIKRRRQWHPTPVLLPGKSHGWRSLEGCSPWGRWGSDMTERLHFHFLLLCIGEGNGNPLQCSCLENPRDGEAWWAAIYGVTQSQTRLKWLSNSNSNIYINSWWQGLYIFIAIRYVWFELGWFLFCHFCIHIVCTSLPLSLFLSCF